MSKSAVQLDLFRTCRLSGGPFNNRILEAKPDEEGCHPPLVNAMIGRKPALSAIYRRALAGKGNTMVYLFHTLVIDEL